MSQRGWTERRAVEVIAHCEVPGVIPDPSDGIAIVVSHHESLPLPQVLAARLCSSVIGYELVHQAAVHGFLLAGIAMALVAHDWILPRNEKRLDPIGIVGQQGPAESVDIGGARTRNEKRFAARVLGH